VMKSVPKADIAEDRYDRYRHGLCSCGQWEKLSSRVSHTVDHRRVVAAVVGLLAVAAVGRKRNTSGHRWRRKIGLRLVVILLIAAGATVPIASTVSRGNPSVLPALRYRAGPASRCVLFCLPWDQRAAALGRNWGPAHVSQGAARTSPQAGPYALIRHPIYTGLILAMLVPGLA